MQTYLADLHVHSKYSRATSRDLDLEHLAWWAARKGIEVVATGDCVHPAWLAELKDKLLPAGEGLFRLKPEIEAAVLATLPAACRRPVRFMLSTEISTIYKKGEKTRKVHHLIYAPDFATVDALAARLGRIGNIASDGRPILGLDSRDLLEVTLASGPEAYLVPAHIWTPWFAAMGSQSGFDSIDACYGDLASHIFAVETGLSSDPAMNWRLSSLDRFRLTSNSDAHSPGKLGREATRFSGEPSYLGIRAALETGEGYGGTVEFFPEEGKYHMDGHRACEVRLDPKETLALEGRCPVCGHRVTVGVAHRVELLADRSEAEASPPPTAGAVTSLVPLPEILSEIMQSGVATKRVAHAYDRATAALGPELALLEMLPLEDIRKADALVAEAVARLRAGQVIREPGYDGEYGVIRLFEARELTRLTKGAMLFEASMASRPVPARRKAAPEPAATTLPMPGPAETPVPVSTRTGILAALDADQAEAAALSECTLIVQAGPGSGKTRMITHRLAHLVAEQGVAPGACLAVTFTRRATEEMQTRLRLLLGPRADQVEVLSFHALGLLILRADGHRLGLPAGFRLADEAERRAHLSAAMGCSDRDAGRLLKEVSRLKRTGQEGEGDAARAKAHLWAQGLAEGWVDFDDLVGLTVRLLEQHAELRDRWSQRFAHIVADEFQDIDEQQYRLLLLLAGKKAHLCVIGDPHQAIYGFRGADSSCFARLRADYPDAQELRLGRNYRSSATIVAAASALIGDKAAIPQRPKGQPIILHAAADETAEAAFVAATIETLIGGHDMLAAQRDSGRAGNDARALGFADIAILYRTDAQARALRQALDEAGIPHKKSSPDRLATHPGVMLILASLPAGEASLTERLDQAIAAAEQQNKTHLAALAEAKAWLRSLAATAGDERALREQVALATELDFHDARAARVALLTMHAAKGLEFPVVFVVGLETGITPFAFGDGIPEDEAEERRLFYVAMTRAMDRLYLTRAARRFWQGSQRMLPPSPYLEAFDATLTTANSQPANPRRRARQLSMFELPAGPKPRQHAGRKAG
ncbi:UvrD-helicase domain-containing protein [Arboricoccus pini]|nr:UvrD-helicase domain-containing protein [Arboricoccus pini]